MPYALWSVIVPVPASAYDRAFMKPPANRALGQERMRLELRKSSSKVTAAIKHPRRDCTALSGRIRHHGEDEVISGSRR